MPGVIEVLEDLAGNGDVTSLLLTGNTPAGARAKLRHYGLDRYVSDGAFCTGPGERDEIARAARSLAAERSAATSPRLFVIGDTPHDVACGKAIGALTIAVATGPTPVEELQASEPWTLLDALPAPAEFRALIGV
jgi:phosphoglycolate phosphatase-like HAD superfamily hydrolase